MQTFNRNSKRLVVHGLARSAYSLTVTFMQQDDSDCTEEYLTRLGTLQVALREEAYNQLFSLGNKISASVLSNADIAAGHQVVLPLGEILEVFDGQGTVVTSVLNGYVPASVISLSFNDTSASLVLQMVKEI